MSEALKFDSGKLRMDLIPPEAVEELAKVLTYGAQKYGDRNWEKELDTGRVVGALLRHLLAWQKGERLDQESGLRHLSHLLCNAVFLVTMEVRAGLGIDRWQDCQEYDRGGGTMQWPMIIRADDPGMRPDFVRYRYVWLSIQGVNTAFVRRDCPITLVEERRPVKKFRTELAKYRKNWWREVQKDTKHFAVRHTLSALVQYGYYVQPDWPVETTPDSGRGRSMR